MTDPSVPAQPEEPAIVIPSTEGERHWTEADAAELSRRLDQPVRFEGVQPIARYPDGRIPIARLRHSLFDHYLVHIECAHEVQQDRAICACSRVDLGFHLTVGDAVRSWIEHVIDKADDPEDEANYGYS